MSEEKVITPFEIGVCVAMTLVGKALAMSPDLDVEQLKKDANKLMDSMPDEPKWAGGTERIHQAATKSLLDGLDKVKR